MNSVTVSNSSEVLTLDDIDRLPASTIFRTQSPRNAQHVDILIVTNNRHFVSLIDGRIWGNASDWLNYVTFEIISEPVTITPQKK